MSTGSLGSFIRIRFCQELWHVLYPQFLTERAGSGSGTVDTSTGSSGCGDPSLHICNASFHHLLGPKSVGVRYHPPLQQRGFLHARGCEEGACPAGRSMFVAGQPSAARKPVFLHTLTDSTPASGGSMKVEGKVLIFSRRIQILSRQVLQQPVPVVLPPSGVWSSLPIKLLLQAPECRLRTRHQSVIRSSRFAKCLVSVDPCLLLHAPYRYLFKH